MPNQDADTVREIYARYLAGQSTGRIARELGLRYEHLVRQILQRESNTGVIVYKGECYPGRHEPLIDRETFARAQRRLHRPRPPARRAGRQAALRAAGVRPLRRENALPEMGRGGR